jgi:RNA polymerase sigma factor (sigma-70 family)
MNFKQFSDTELLGAYTKAPQREILGELYRRYSALVFGISLKYLKNSADAEDSVMEIFEKLHLELGQQLAKAEIGSFKGWLHTVSRNHCLMKLRKAGLKINYTDELPPVSAPDSFDEEVHLQREHILKVLEDNLSALKKEQKECITLFFLEDKSYKEICDQTGLSLGEIKSHIQNGKLNLKKAMNASK